MLLIYYIGTAFVCVCVFCRDDLYRVELDNMAGDEMFYSKVRFILFHTHKTKCILIIDHLHVHT